MVIYYYYYDKFVTYCHKYLLLISVELNIICNNIRTVY